MWFTVLGANSSQMSSHLLSVFTFVVSDSTLIAPESNSERSSRPLAREISGESLSSDAEARAPSPTRSDPAEARSVSN
ncbi:unnamed protein product [Pieris brassicae]|uniref:Uncharacterized protein n=1 Tax=Pieris brassicae TaxID=7116 RepID=A0A9P0TBI1_PIEBR|nr:unnamed protein product [Pieris brassicae]